MDELKIDFQKQISMTQMYDKKIQILRLNLCHSKDSENKEISLTRHLSVSFEFQIFCSQLN